MTCGDGHVEAAAQLLGPLPLCAASGGLLRPTAAWPLLPGAASSSSLTITQYGPRYVASSGPVTAPTYVCTPPGLPPLAPSPLL